MSSLAIPSIDAPALVRSGLPMVRTGIDPAANTDYINKIGGKFISRLLTVSCRLVTDANVASRALTIQFLDDSEVRYALAGPATTTPASQTNDYFWSAWLGVDIFTVDSTALAPLPPILQFPTYSWRIHLTNGQAADQISRIKYIVEDFYTTNQPRHLDPSGLT